MTTELAVASLCGAAAVGAACYHRKRKKSPVKVNCWFCNRDSEVHRGNRNCWDCPYCDQYNGFDADGGYNKPIPAQHDEGLNHGAAALIIRRAASPGATRSSAEGNGLCDRCNRDQRLKIAQLAHFVPRNHEREDAELDAYVRHLDSEYRLCDRCQSVLRRTLSRQDAVLRPNLLEWHVKTGRKRRDSAVQERDERPRVPPPVRVLQFVSASCALALCFGSLCQPEVRKLHRLLDGYLAQRSHAAVQACERWGLTLAAAGFCCAVAAILGAGKHALRVIDAVACFVWLLLFLAHAAPVADRAFGGDAEKRAVRTVAAALGVAVALGCAAAERPARRRWRSWKGRGCSRSPASSYLGPPSSYADSSAASEEEEAARDYDALQDNEVTTSSPGNGFRTPPPSEDTLVLDCGIKAMKIGTPQKSPLISSGAFGVQRPVLPLRLDLSSPGKRRPLVSPSRFRSVGLRDNLPGVSVGCPVSRAGSEAGDDGFSAFGEPPVAARDRKLPTIGSAAKTSRWTFWLFCVLTGLSLALNIHLVNTRPSVFLPTATNVPPPPTF